MNSKIKQLRELIRKEVRLTLKEVSPEVTKAEEELRKAKGAREKLAQKVSQQTEKDSTNKAVDPISPSQKATALQKPVDVMDKNIQNLIGKLSKAKAADLSKKTQP